MLEFIALAFEDESGKTPGPIASIHSVSKEVAKLATSNVFEEEVLAIRLYRQETGASLREALRVVEDLKSAS